MPPRLFLCLVPRLCRNRSHGTLPRIVISEPRGKRLVDDLWALSRSYSYGIFPTLYFFPCREKGSSVENGSFRGRRVFEIAPPSPSDDERPEESTTEPNRTKLSSVREYTCKENKEKTKTDARRSIADIDPRGFTLVYTGTTAVGKDSPYILIRVRCAIWRAAESLRP